MTNLNLAEEQKRAAAEAALEYVKSGMKLGLGTGSTAEHFVRQLALRVNAGMKVTTVATSERTATLARELGITVSDLGVVRHLDLTVDGADEIGPGLSLIKGGGGALLREKIIAASSSDYVIIADEAKPVDVLGGFPLPVEVVQFGLALTARKIEAALQSSGCPGTRAVLRNDVDGQPFVSDGGNVILDCHCERIPNPEALAEALGDIPGVVEHGLFLGMAKTLIIGMAQSAEVRTR